MASTATFSRDAKSTNGPVRKKLKTSDLPLASATRAAIEGLAHIFKKKGGYDNLRHQVWQDLEHSNFEKEFTSSLLKVAEEELDKNPEQLLKVGRGKATLLIEGAVDRAGVYQSAEAQIDRLIDAHIEEIESGIRALRRKDIGDEAANAEQSRGGKTEEQYAEEAAGKQAAREKVREEAREKDRAAIEERRRLRKEEESKLEKEQEKRREEREARKKSEREREEERERDREKERERDRERIRERDRERDREREKDRDRERERERDRRDSQRRSKYDDDPKRPARLREPSEPVSKAALSQDDIERLEQEALQDLLKEGQKVARRSRHQMELDIDETLAPPPRKTAPASAINPISRSSDVKKSTSAKIKTEDTGSKTPLSDASGALEEGESVEKKSRGRSRSKDRASVRKSSRETARLHRDSRDDRYDRGSRRDDSREIRRHTSSDRYDRRRKDSRDRDTKHRRSSREDDRERASSRSRDRRRTFRSRSRSRDRVKRSTPPPSPRDREALEVWKQEGVKKREAEAKAYLAAQKEAREKGLPVPGWAEYMASLSKKPDDKVASPASIRKREPSQDRASRARSRSKSPIRRRGSRVERSTSPVNIDRYVPGGGSTRDRRGSATNRSPTRRRDSIRHRDDRRHRDRSRSRDRTRRSYRSRSRSRSRSRDRRRDYRSSRDDDRTRRRSRDRDRDRDVKSRYRSRSRSRSRDRRRDRSRSRDRDRDRDRHRDRVRDRSRSRSPREEKDSRRN